MNIIAYAKEQKDKIIIAVLVLWLFGALFIGFYILSYFITSLGSLFLFFVLIFILLYFGTRLATFPGAFFF